LISLTELKPKLKKKFKIATTSFKSQQLKILRQRDAKIQRQLFPRTGGGRKKIRKKSKIGAKFE
jgi:hypothetical protein